MYVSHTSRKAVAKISRNTSIKYTGNRLGGKPGKAAAMFVIGRPHLLSPPGNRWKECLSAAVKLIGSGTVYQVRK